MVELKKPERTLDIERRIESYEELRRMSPVRFECLRDKILQTLEGKPHKDLADLSEKEIRQIKEKLEI